MAGCPACKIIINADLQAAVDSFHKLAALDLLTDSDYAAAMEADEKALKVYRKINQGAADRQKRSK